MISLCIKSNKNDIIDFLFSDIANIDLDNITFVKKQFSKYINLIVHYSGNNESEFYSALSNSIANCILCCYEEKIIHKLSMQNYFYFDNDDIVCIEKICNLLLSDAKCVSCESDDKFFSAINHIDNPEFDSVLSEIANRKNILWCKVLKYISSHKSMLLEGFITFRIKDYIDILNNAVDFSVSQFVINREYTEFIDLLKIYINSHQINCNLVHLVYVNNESLLLDEEKNIISLTKNNLDTKFLSDITFSSNDYALNSLLTLLPKKIIIHLINPEDDFINTIKSIFGDRVTICTNCNICKTYRLLNNEQGLNS